MNQLDINKLAVVLEDLAGRIAHDYVRDFIEDLNRIFPEAEWTLGPNGRVGGVLTHRYEKRYVY